MQLLKLKRVWVLIFIALTYATLSSCRTSNIILQTAPNNPVSKIATPEIAATTLSEWEAQKDHIDKLLQRDVYGTVPPPAKITSVNKTPLNPNIYKGQGRAENWNISIEIPREDGQTAQTAFNVAVILPESDSPVPIISMQTFCPTYATLPDLGLKGDGDNACSGDGFGAGLMFYVFGRYIASPPIEDILERGYGIAAMYPSEIIPDRRVAGRSAMTDLFGSSPLGPGHNASVITGWAYIWAVAAQALANDKDVNDRQIAGFGHSRYGKSALLAAVWSDNISAVVSHQSGTGGASLNRNKKGETVTQIMEAYPHWFAPAYAKYDTQQAIDVDQHHLLALIAPRPILLGNARRDVWSDPEGAFHAATAADRVYELYGTNGLSVDKLNFFDPSADLSFWIRGGTHGIVKEDWTAFLEFLDSHFKK